MRRNQFLIVLFICIVFFYIQGTFAIAADEWVTYFEKTDSLGTPRYAETVRYFSRLADAAPEAMMSSFGVSPEGRDLPVMIISKDQKFSAQEARKSGKPIVMIQCCIHPGESEGKDAAMLLARDILIYDKYADILNETIIMIIPIINVDGHERFGPYNRINQNGPEEMGWRVTSTRLNMNRDFVKADAPEMRAWLNLFNKWKPHLFFDCHTTDGVDHQYVIAYNIDEHVEFGGAVSSWARESLMPSITKACNAKGHLIVPYAGFFDRKNPDKGLRGGVWPPMLSNPYVTLRNSAGVLIESHSLKTYPVRVRATYDFLLAAIEHVATKPQDLIDAVAAEQRRASDLGSTYRLDSKFPLTFTRDMNRGDTLLYYGYQIEIKDGPIAGQGYISYTEKPRNFPVVFYNYVKPDVEIVPPLGYIVPRQWTNVIEVLKAHGAELHLLEESVTDTFETYRFEDVKFSSRSYEGRHRPSYKAVSVNEVRTLPAGSVFVPLGNEESKIIMNILEPQAPDALVGWGFFNTIFEHREYFESYVMEPMAQKMIAEDEELRQKFEQKVASDSVFAANPRARLQFFYERTPYWDTEKDSYPVVRVTRELF